ncbi:hypothetical protein FE257_009134 [Aspergillus nanangensis]|uniref:Rhodopsin domain-containing protein n=1 Tax=Aspergillus nanangensis TaxID=2582783 RepID=A0AAD4GYQ2_ASPNN|nr:hypothetical protein FE257_009134 [Aspergillus nanangensis]
MDTSLPLEGRSRAIFIVSVVMLAISCVAVLLRSFVRLYLVRAFGWDDALMVVAMALFTLLCVTCIVGSHLGVGHRIIEFKSLDSLEKALLWWWLGQILYLWSSAVAKVSIAMALLRLTVRKMHRNILWGTISVVIVIGLMFWLVLLLDCNPVSYFWHRVDPTQTGKCLPTKILIAIAYLYSSITILCDFTLGIMPAVLIWNLQMNKETKVALIGILSLGAVASVAVVIRVPFLHNYADDDFLYSTYQIAIWSVVETGLAIVAGSLVTLRPLFRWVLGGSASYARHRRYQQTSGGNYPLSGVTAHYQKSGASDPKYWRPDITLDERTNTVVISPSHLNTSSSQEHLRPESGSSAPQNQVNVLKTFRVTDDC